MRTLLAGRDEANRAGGNQQFRLQNAAGRHDRELGDGGIGDEADAGLQGRDASGDRRAELIGAVA